MKEQVCCDCKVLLKTEEELLPHLQHKREEIFEVPRSRSQPAFKAPWQRENPNDWNNGRKKPNYTKAP